MSKVSSGCRCSHYHISRKTSNTLAGSALSLPPLTRSGRSSNSFQPTDYHKETRWVETNSAAQVADFLKRQGIELETEAFEL